MKQINMFGAEFAPDKENQIYTTKIETPVYEPKNDKPHILELYDRSKTTRLIREITETDIDPEIKTFLVEAARRHTVFNYERIADYYAHAPKEVQALMEKSGLVIIDFERAIQLGYVRLCDEIRSQFLSEYGQE